MGERIEDLLREQAPGLLAALVRRSGDFDASEDAAQEALLAAAMQWPSEGVPENPRGWLVTVASRRLVEMWRSDASRRRREAAVAVRELPDSAPISEYDDTLTLLTLCCHPVLPMPSQVALTLRAVGGLTTAEIARAFLVPEATLAQRISRAKQRIRKAGARFLPPEDGERAGRIAAVLQVLYLIFNEGYAATSGPRLQRVELTTEAVRLARQVHAALPDDGEACGLLALMLLTDARRPARTSPGGLLVPLAEQDRARWDGAAIAEGTALLRHALATSPVGPYQVQAAIAALHDEAAAAADTDWPQILVLYDLLAALSPGPMVALNRAVAVAMVDGPRAGLAALDGVRELAGHHRADAVRAHLLEMAGDTDGATGAAGAYRRAAQATASVPERDYLLSRLARIEGDTPRD